jgi:L-threonylcarbamoyladenylate synthase
MTQATPTPTELQAAIAALRSGQAIGLPTETVYGLAADAENPAAVARIFSLKQRPANHPLIVHIAGAGQLGRYAREIPESAYLLADAFWPGPLTLILKRGAAALDAITGGQDSIGLRAPAHPVARAVIETFGHGLAAPSANRFGRISPTRAAHVREEFGDAVPVVLDGGDCQIGIESTIVDLTASPPRVLRPGRIHPEDIASIIGPVAVGAGDRSPRAPGNLESHYAPVTPLHLTSREELASDHDQPALTIGALPDSVKGIALAVEPKAYARELYAALRELDRIGARRINAELPPDNEEWRAVNDRLRRAASPAGSAPR